MYANNCLDKLIPDQEPVFPRTEDGRETQYFGPGPEATVGACGHGWCNG